jgi:hypothetical protein
MSDNMQEIICHPIDNTEPFALTLRTYTKVNDLRRKIGERTGHHFLRLSICDEHGNELTGTVPSTTKKVGVVVCGEPVERHFEAKVTTAEHTLTFRVGLLHSQVRTKDVTVSYAMDRSLCRTSDLYTHIDDYHFARNFNVASGGEPALGLYLCDRSTGGFSVYLIYMPATRTWIPNRVKGENGDYAEITGFEIKEVDSMHELMVVLPEEPPRKKARTD